MAFEDGRSVLTRNAPSASAKALWLHDAIADVIARAHLIARNLLTAVIAGCKGQLLPIRPPDQASKQKS
jgi:hypothetical protein